MILKLAAGSLTALRLGRGLQSSIRSRWADQSVVRCPAAQSNPRPPLLEVEEEEARHRSELALACTSRPDGERKSDVSRGWSCDGRQVVVDRVGVTGEAADLAVAQS